MSGAATKLVLAYDGSPAAQRALELAAGYRGERSRLEVLAVNVQQRPVTMFPGMGIDPAALDAALAQAIVMGTRGHGALHGFALGSAAMRVAHGGVAPALIVGPEAALPRALGERLRVLCALDGSEPALRALERVLAWRAWLGELEIHLAHVQAPVTLLEKMVPPHEDTLAQWRGDEGDEAAQGARELLARASLRPELHVAAGDPAAEIGRLARETKCELLALGTRGRGAAHHALVGSVALKAAAASPVPALLVA